LKDGPSVRGSYKTSRASSTACLRLLVSSRGLATGHTPETRSPSGHHFAPAGSPLFQNLIFENCLPINLRMFLIGELGPRVHIDDSTIAPASNEPPEVFMRDLARAIRRFSFARAHESWIEVTGSRAMVEEGLNRAQAVLCLQCARLALGAELSSEHRDSSCVAVALHAGDSHDAERPAASELRRSLYRQIANFRRSREHQGLPHYELDYYMRDNCYVFTWRPLLSS
jgi:hypothetical protein